MRPRIRLSMAILLMLCPFTTGCDRSVPAGLREEPVLQNGESPDGQQGERTRIKMH